MSSISKINFLSFGTRITTNLAPVVQKIFSTHVCNYTTSVKIPTPILFIQSSKISFVEKKRKKSLKLKLKSERGVFAPHHKLKQISDGISTEEKEYLSSDRSNFLVPNFFYNLSMHTGREYKPIPGNFKTVPIIQRGYDYYTNYSRKEDTFSYQDSIFQYKKYKLGEYIFTKRIVSHIHLVKKKK
jgi:hypothetical protein